MKYTLPAITLFIMSAAFMGCSKTNGKGPVGSKIVNISGNYNEIELSGVGNAEVIASTSDFVEIRTHENLFDIFDIKVKDQTLIIGIKKNQNIGNFTELSFIVNTSKVIKEAEVTGSGNMYLTGPTISYNKFEAKISGSGDIVAQDIAANEVEAEISGSGSVTLTGTANKTDFEIAGSGDVHAFDLSSVQTEATITGSGYIRTTTISKLDAKITGSGHVIYKGTPVITSAITGSGKVVDGN